MTDIDVGLWSPHVCTHTHTCTYTIHMHANLLGNSLHFRKGDWSRNCTLTFEDTRYWLFVVTLPSLDLFISLFGVEEIGVVHWLGRECLDPLGTAHL